MSPDPLPLCQPSSSAELAGTFTLMTARQAEKIWQFVYEKKDQAGAVVVHCEAGVSRSPAVAAAPCKGLGGNDRQFFRRYQPNMHVYRLMLEEARKRAADPPSVGSPE